MTIATAPQLADLAARRRAKDAYADALYRRSQIAESVYAAEVYVAVAGVLPERKANLVCDSELDTIARALYADTPVEAVAEDLVDRYWDMSLTERDCD
jgi:hypothetical protein